MKTYRKVATVQAKIFEQGDEDGFVINIFTSEDGERVPYIKKLENQQHKGEFGKHYICTGIDGERWLVEKSIFERTYELVERDFKSE